MQNVKKIGARYYSVKSGKSVVPVAMILFPFLYHFTIPFYRESFFVFSVFFVFSDLISVERRRSEAVFGLCSLCGEKGGSRLEQAGAGWWNVVGLKVLQSSGYPLQKIGSISLPNA